MKIFCDTNVLVAASIASHQHHHEAQNVIRGVMSNTDTGFIAAHSLAETFSVLTRLPLSKRLSPQAAARFLRENLIGDFTIVSLTADEYVSQISAWERGNVSGGKIYDALQLACAAKVDPDRIYTFNVGHFKSLASADMQGKIEAPAL